MPSLVLCVILTKQNRIYSRILCSKCKLYLSNGFNVGCFSKFSCELPPASNRRTGHFICLQCMLSSFYLFIIKCVFFGLCLIAENSKSEVEACTNLFLYQHTQLQALTLRVFWRCHLITFSCTMLLITPVMYSKNGGYHA